MNTIQSKNQKELLDLEELESWETKDFDDVLVGFELSNQEYEFISNESYGWDASSLH